MFQQVFVDRVDELELLEDTYKQHKSSPIIIYGRRRIGEIELVKQFIKDKKHVYFLADTRTYLNIETKLYNYVPKRVH